MSSTTTMAAAIVSVNLTTNVRIFFWHNWFEFFSSPSTCAAHMTEIQIAPQKGTAMPVYGQSEESKVSRLRSLIRTELILDS